ncbi:MAG: hypothetical protein IJW49_07565 [Clostridia bacterium]|nr:hypothetical protein [Clostridia bacterium]
MAMTLTEGVTCERELEKTNGKAAAPRLVCFVCTGNTCRSPMAAAVTNALAEKEKSGYAPLIADAMTPRVLAFSRGLYAEDGAPISANAVEALERSGIVPVRDADYHAHTARTIDEEDVRAADLLVAVSGSHATELLMRFPWAASKITCLPKAITDPWGGNLGVYEACLAEITECVRSMFFAKES